MTLHICDHPVIQEKLGALRDASTPPSSFRVLVRDLAVCLTYEATRLLPTSITRVQTPLESSDARVVACHVGLVPVLRAGLGMVDGALSLLPNAQVWHLGLYRDEENLLPVEYYNRLPSTPSVDVALILDPMLATGGSAIAVVEVLKRWGVRDVRLLGIIGARAGLQRLGAAHPDVPVYLAALDERLNDRGYIVPGLGDAGDRQFGTL